MTSAGNHDITLDPEFYKEYGLQFHNQFPQDSSACMNVFEDYTSITLLNHVSANVRLTKDGGPGTTFKVFGSPYSPINGLWAFGYPPERASKLWDQIPLDSDIVITHTPPRYHCDESKARGAAGCEVLRQTLWRVRPSLAICGHVHEGRGVERVLWDLASPNIKYKENENKHWEDPGIDNKKQCLVDLTSKGTKPLENMRSAGEKGHVSVEEISSLNTLPENIVQATRGQGGTPPSARCDMEALSGRMERKETCIINAAIMTSSWPHKGSSIQKKYNKPIVVDLDLPVWQEEYGVV